MATKTKKLPKGLQEFEGSLHDLEYAGRLLPRLADLPESAFNKHLADFNRAMAQVELAEAAAANARNLARDVAMTAWNLACREWSIKELQEATGYDDQ